MTDPRPDPTTPLHVHRRNDWRPCPATMRPPLTPRKHAAVWWFAWAEAIRFEETLAAFVNAWPAEFPRLAGES